MPRPRFSLCASAEDGEHSGIIRGRRPFHQNAGAIRRLIFYAWRSLLNVWRLLKRGGGDCLRPHPHPPLWDRERVIKASSFPPARLLPSEKFVAKRCGLVGGDNQPNAAPTTTLGKNNGGLWCNNGAFFLIELTM
ncbi:hypothetical protein JTE90_005841 [Oedothorax gibbosus]|uniref:Uncharacterized protein n=1 Tax=Oedothorax gibbosus TaxID=931172 RepID=A0AAV6V4H7_9ARAC|nr:hypothetical protein JTE90_005841 [Oedothorax gibbosus]